jgi:hypothetical protein
MHGDLLNTGMHLQQLDVQPVTRYPNLLSHSADRWTNGRFAVSGRVVSLGPPLDDDVPFGHEVLYLVEIEGFPQDLLALERIAEPQRFRAIRQMDLEARVLERAPP